MVPNGECAGTNSRDVRDGAADHRRHRPGILNGWNMRPGDWQIGASVQQQLLARLDGDWLLAAAGYQNFTTTDNTLVTPRLHTVQHDGASRFAAAGWRRLPGRTLHNIARKGSLGASNNITLADNFGGQSQTYNGVLFNISARAANGLNFQGGVNTGVTVTDGCDVRAALPETNIRATSGTARTTPAWSRKVTVWARTPSRRSTCCSVSRSAATRVRPCGPIRTRRRPPSPPRSAVRPSARARRSRSTSLLPASSGATA